MIGPHPFHMVGEKYADAIMRAAGGLPLLIPVLPDRLAEADLLDSLDGLLFPGSPSNIEPHHYDEGPSRAGTLHDPERDATTLPLVRAALASGVPLLGVCRGFQEINVALGGSLWQHVEEEPGMLDHREDKAASLVLRGLAGGAARVAVNSLHSQGVKRLAPGLRVEARAPDGLIEAFAPESAQTFALAVQWHPEWQVMSNDFSRAGFAAFGDAARQRATRRAARNRG